MLVRSCLDVVSLSRVIQSTVIFGAVVVSFGNQNLSFGMLFASSLTLWGTIERFRGARDHKKGDLGAQVLISADWISGPPFKSFRQFWNKKCVFVMRV